MATLFASSYVKRALQDSLTEHTLPFANTHASQQRLLNDARGPREENRTLCDRSQERHTICFRCPHGPAAKINRCIIRCVLAAFNNIILPHRQYGWASQHEV